MERVSRIDMLLEMLQKEPGDIFLNYALGLEYANDRENVASAEKQFRMVLNTDENYIAAYYQLGKLLESTLRINEALAVYQDGLIKAKAQHNHKAINEFGEAIFLLEE